MFSIIPNKIKLAVAFFGLLAFAPAMAFAESTVVLSTTTYNGANQDDLSEVALPEVGAYIFDMVATSSGAIVGIESLVLYLQQSGVSGGGWYTVRATTFTTCNSNCTQFSVPDIYLGGSIRARWTITSGSATVTVTARKVSP